MLRILPALLCLLLAAPLPVWAGTAVQVGFRDGVYRGPNVAAASELLLLSSRDGSLPAGLESLHLQLPASHGPLERDWVLERLKAAAPTDTSFAWFGPVLLPRAAELQRVSPEALVQTARSALEALLAKRATGFDVEPVSRPEELALETGAMALKTSLADTVMLRPRMAVKVDVYLDGIAVRSVPVWFAVQAYGRMPVYAHDMQARQEVSVDDLRWEERDMASLAGTALGDAGSLQGRWLTRPVKAGEPALARDLAVEPLVWQRQRVEVRVLSGPVAISAWGTAQASGDSGDMVDVLVDQAEGPCKGKVIGRGVVQIGN